MAIAAVVFDLDGTLIDSFALIAAAFRRAARAVLGRALTDAEVASSWGEPLAVRAAHLAPGRAEALVNAYTAEYDAVHSQLRAFPGVPPMLAALASRGCRMGIATSKRRRSTAQALALFGWETLMQAVVCAEDVSATKPAPDAILEVLRRLRVAAAEALMVGDGTFDIEAAKWAGVRSAAALWGARDREAVLAAGPDYVANCPADVPSLVGSG